MSADLLVGRSAVVTGGAQGIGLEIVRAFLDEGANVLLVDRNAESVSTAVSLMGNVSSLLTAALDITDYGAYREAMNEARAAFGGLDILVNNAAICFPRTVTTETADTWRQTLSVNLDALFFGCQMILPHFIDRGGGRIINLTSINAWLSSGRWPSYDASKGAIVAVTKSLAVDLAQYGVIANAIAPGFIRTPMSVVDGVDETEAADFQEWFLRRRHVPLARVGEPQDVAAAAIFLASDYCRYITGHVLVVDGGMTSRTWHD